MIRCRGARGGADQAVLPEVIRNSRPGHRTRTETRGRQTSGAASLRGMDPTIGAALISGGWATAVAAVGYAYNLATTKATIAATNANALTALDAAHEAQLWDKRAAAYVDAIGVISRTLVIRLLFISPEAYDEETVERLRPILGEPRAVDWALVSAEITAYAPQPILDAMDTSAKAQNEFDAKHKTWKVQSGQVGSDLYNVARDAGVAANSADSKLQDLLRADLALRPSERAGQPRAMEPAARPQPWMLMSPDPHPHG